mgnify:CR=1 FL=1
MTTSIRFEALIDSYHDELFAYLWRLLRDAADAEDAAQETFLRAYRAFARLRPGSNHRAWLYKIATNCAYTALKRRRQRANHSTPLLDEAHPDDGPRPDELAVAAEGVAVVRRAVEALPAKQRAAVVMRHVQGLDYTEIAEALACSEDSARANAYQGIRRLRQTLGREEMLG